MEEEEYSSESEFTKSDSTYVLSPAAQETKRKMEAVLPNSLRQLLSWPEIPSLSTESTGLRDTIQTLLQKEKLGGHQKARLRLMNEELAWRQSSGIDLDLTFIHKKEQHSKLNSKLLTTITPAEPTILPTQ